MLRYRISLALLMAICAACGSGDGTAGTEDGGIDAAVPATGGAGGSGATGGTGGASTGGTSTGGTGGASTGGTSGADAGACTPGTWDESDWDEACFE